MFIRYDADSPTDFIVCAFHGQTDVDNSLKIAIDIARKYGREKVYYDEGFSVACQDKQEYAQAKQDYLKLKKQMRVR